MLSVDASTWPAGTFLHGTHAKFPVFKPGGHGAIYFSDPSEHPGSKTQAEWIAGGGLGGWLAEVKLKAGKPARYMVVTRYLIAAVRRKHRRTP